MYKGLVREQLLYFILKSSTEYGNTAHTIAAAAFI